MIYVTKNNVEEKSFLQLLESTRTLALERLANDDSLKNMGGDGFETFVYERMLEASKGTEFENTVEQTGAHAFPDIIAKKLFGVEVKVTQGDKWLSTGNSVLETTRIEDVKRIFLFFGKLGGNADIKFRLYQECLYDIGVTHSPRYKINMELELGSSIFEKIGINYEDLRNEEKPISKIKDYFRTQLKKGQELWWIDQEDAEKTVDPIIKTFDTLDVDTQENFILETMILMPEIFGTSRTKYERAAAYLVTEYNSVSSSLRDKFSASGRETVVLEDSPIEVPRILFQLYRKATLLEKRIQQIDGEKLLYYWRLTEVPSDRLAFWKKLLEENTQKVDLQGKNAVQVFDAGLTYGQES